MQHDDRYWCLLGTEAYCLTRRQILFFVSCGIPVIVEPDYKDPTSDIQETYEADAAKWYRLKKREGHKRSLE